jgi:YlmC/YmxH family sporulation protein
MLKISELQTKDVVNIIDGRKLGTVSDLEINLKHGRIDALVCPGPGKFFGLFSGGQDIVIPWTQIVKIGSDVILVRLEEKTYLLEDKENPRPKEKEPYQDPPVYRPYTHTS